MNDPHVKSLHYRVIPGTHVDYEKADPLVIETENFIGKINFQEAIFEMKTHYGTKEAAREVIESYLRRWELLIGLDHDPGDLSFRFQHVEVIDRNPTDANTIFLNVHSTSHSHTAMDAVLHVSRGVFPPPPQKFALSLDVDTMYARYRAYREGKESLLSMAYMCLTILEASAGGRADAAKKYAIAKPVLDKFGNLCSEKGAPHEARKYPKNRTFEPISNSEKEWITQVIKASIRRLGEYAHDSTAILTQLTMNDFPKI